jgi:hypothetical protein
MNKLDSLTKKKEELLKKRKELLKQSKEEKKYLSYRGRIRINNRSYRNYIYDEEKRKLARLNIKKINKEFAEVEAELMIIEEAIHRIKVNELIEVAPPINKLIKYTDPKSVENRIYNIIATVTHWINIEGNYSQNKLAKKINLDKSTFSRFLDKTIHRDEKKITARSLLIKKVRESLEVLDEKEKTKEVVERKARLNYFYECLVNEASKNDRLQGKQKNTYYNPRDEN